MSSDSSRKIRVALFVSIALALLVFLVMLLGRSQSLFTRRATLHAAFRNTGGLVVGAPVRLAGVDIGSVQSIEFAPNLQVRTVHVALTIERQYLERIREDSRARLSSKGLLGDMIVDVSVGSGDRAALQSGADLATEETQGFAEVATEARAAIDQVKTFSSHATDKLGQVITDELAHDLKRIAHSTANVMETVESGPGLAHALIYDREPARQLAQFLQQANQIAGDSKRTVSRLERMVASIESNEGTLHALIYRDDGAKLLADARSSMIEMRRLSEVLRGMGDQIADGQGTIGALIKDPSLYEDLKTIMGNIQRNRILRSVARYAIQSDRLGAPNE